MNLDTQYDFLKPLPQYETRRHSMSTTNNVRATSTDILSEVCLYALATPYNAMLNIAQTRPQSS